MSLLPLRLLVLLLLVRSASAQPLDLLPPERPVVAGRVAVRLRAGASLAALGLAAAGGTTSGELAELGFEVVAVPVRSERAAASFLAARSEVRAATPIYRYAPAFVPADPYYASQYHHALVGSPVAWDLTRGSAAHPVAVVDTGVDAQHPDLRGRLLAGRNFHAGNADTSDLHGHGTAVAGVLAATGHNGAGVAGMVWQNPILPVRICGADGTATSDTIAAAIRWAAQRGARVINVSFGPLQGDALVSAAARHARSRGALVFVAAGNEGVRTPVLADPAILFVGATDRNDRRAIFSTYGPAVQLAAPGVSIATSGRAAPYIAASGTSFASPIAAGVAALAWAVNPALSADQVAALLARTAVDRGRAGFDEEYGAGRVSASAAVTAARATLPPGPATPPPAPPVVTPPAPKPTPPTPKPTPPAPAPPPRDATPPTARIERPTTGAVLSGPATVSTAVSDDRGVVAVSLTVDGSAVATETQPPFTFSWDTSRATPGPHVLALVARDAAGNAGYSAPVTVQVANVPVTLEIVTPSRDNFWLGASLAVSWRSSRGLAFRDVVVLVNGAPRSAALAGFRAQGSLAVPAYAGLSRGRHAIQVRGTDARGRVQTSNAVPVVRP